MSALPESLPAILKPDDEGDHVILPAVSTQHRSGGPNTHEHEYALLELLRSERTYVKDLVLLRDYQIPLASGVS